MSAHRTIAAGHLREARSRVQQAIEALKEEPEAADLGVSLEFLVDRIDMHHALVLQKSPRPRTAPRSSDAILSPPRPD